nr:MAG TPA: hypothetical protein [Caudoviricetes sp.]
MTISAPYIFTRQGSDFGGLFLPALLIVGWALLFYSVPCHLFARLCGPISRPYSLPLNAVRRLLRRTGRPSGDIFAVLLLL